MTWSRSSQSLHYLEFCWSLYPVALSVWHMNSAGMTVHLQQVNWYDKGNVVWLLDSLSGKYVVQTFMHSLIAILIIERAIQIWHIKNPLTQFRYRIMTLILPACMLPIYQLINFDRVPFFSAGQCHIQHERMAFHGDMDLVPLSAIFMLLWQVLLLFFFCRKSSCFKDILARKGDDFYSTYSSDPEIDDLAKKLSQKLG